MSTAPEKTKKQEKDEVGLSQSRLILRRFLRHKIAVASLIVIFLITGLAFTSIGFGPIPGWWPLTFQQLNTPVNGGQPTLSLIPKWAGGEGISLGAHPFGQDRIGKDNFAQVMRGIQNSLTVMFVVAAIATVLGTIVGGIAGFYRGVVDNILMRITDLFIIIPTLVIAAVLGQIASGAGLGVGVLFLGALLGLFGWMGMARLVRAEFLSLREREFVDAAKMAGASDRRIIFKHIVPNAIGVIIVTATLLMAGAILLEAALGYLNLGVRPPDVSLGGLISQNQSSFVTRPWLFWWPGVFIILLTLAVNFVGDGLRDAFDPRQSRFRPRRRSIIAAMFGSRATGAGMRPSDPTSPRGDEKRSPEGTV
ncbi:peptide/nickel transport system permease protein [Microcella putealis]|uniref:Peptide/nickel transport system permease protein n=1 Tax=Microcella putealis TaxID=337005 RepID=A0A4Q7LXU0_9MICO|nr:ABC transporter permease [Microcella putealis]RZS59511.1 peptide/nickel transport system permease protein [Microcella putealis]TQM26624.1 peptide/nickel transport system permease protein [Microcella putealis]